MLRNCVWILVTMVAVKAILAVTPHWFGYVVAAGGYVAIVLVILRVREERRVAVLQRD